MITRESIDSVLDAARIEEVVGDYVHLKKRGSNLIGLCPFHDEKTPSFVVSPHKGFYKCFGCGVSGDAIKFVMEHEQMSYPEAIRHLGQKFNVKIEEVSSGPVDEEKRSRKESLLIVMKYAADFFHKELTEGEEGRAIGLSYFKERQFSSETIEAFLLGYSPGGYDTFYKQAVKDGHSEELLEACGLVKKKEDGSYFDFFRERVMFPIHNVSGKVIAFGGRILDSTKKTAKYINTPETEIYVKSKIVYGIHQARQAIRQRDVCLLVEGYTDVLSLYQAGVHNVVASSGTALTTEQVRLIKRYTNNIVLIYDADPAGLKAALRGVDLILENDMNVKVLTLPDGEDPDSFVRSAGRSGFMQFIEENQKDFILFKADLLLKDVKDDPALKSEAIKDIVRTISFIEDPVKRSVYLRSCSERLDMDEAVLLAEVNRIAMSKIREKSRRAESAVDVPGTEGYFQPRREHRQTPPASALSALERGLVKALIRYAGEPYKDDQDVSAFIRSKLSGKRLSDPNLDRILQAFHEKHPEMSGEDILQELMKSGDERLQETVVDLSTEKYEISSGWNRYQGVLELGASYRKEVLTAVNRYLLHIVQDQIRKLDEKIRQASPETNVDRLKKLRQQQFLLKQKLSESIGQVVFPKT